MGEHLRASSGRLVRRARRIADRSFRQVLCGKDAMRPPARRGRFRRAYPLGSRGRVTCSQKKARALVTATIKDTRRTVVSSEPITERVDSISCVTSGDQRRTVAAEARQHGPYLEVQGPQGTRLVPLDGGVVHVGRGLTADLYLDDSSISRRHAIIVSRGSGRSILDDRSLNGTFVNGQCVERADLQDSDVITIGHFALIYHVA